MIKKEPDINWWFQSLISCHGYKNTFLNCCFLFSSEDLLSHISHQYSLFLLLFGLRRVPCFYDEAELMFQQAPK